MDDIGGLLKVRAAAGKFLWEGFERGHQEGDLASLVTCVEMVFSFGFSSEGECVFLCPKRFFGMGQIGDGSVWDLFRVLNDQGRWGRGVLEEERGFGASVRVLGNVYNTTGSGWSDFKLVLMFVYFKIRPFTSRGKNAHSQKKK